MAQDSNIGTLAAQGPAGDAARIDYEHTPVADVLKQRGVEAKAGLSDAEAAKRLERYGPNALEEKKASALAM
jgi:hypothetical protein